MPRGLVAGFILVSICVAVHTTGMLLIAGRLNSLRRIIERHMTLGQNPLLLSLVFTVITLLHLTEIFIWAVAFRLIGLLHNFENAIYFSLGSYTTNGSGGIALPEEWRLLGGLESIVGMLLCGLSTAFLFTIVRDMVEIQSRKRNGPGS